MEQAFAHLLDFSQPFDSKSLDQICAMAADGLNPNRQAAEAFLVEMTNHPEMWKRTDAVLETTASTLTAFFMLQVLMVVVHMHLQYMERTGK